jgi:hypothetical protein
LSPAGDKVLQKKRPTGLVQKEPRAGEGPKAEGVVVGPNREQVKQAVTLLLKHNALSSSDGSDALAYLDHLYSSPEYKGPDLLKLDREQLEREQNAGGQWGYTITRVDDREEARRYHLAAEWTAQMIKLGYTAVPVIDISEFPAVQKLREFQNFIQKAYEKTLSHKRSEKIKEVSTEMQGASNAVPRQLKKALTLYLQSLHKEIPNLHKKSSDFLLFSFRKALQKQRPDYIKMEEGFRKHTQTGPGITISPAEKESFKKSVISFFKKVKKADNQFDALFRKLEEANKGLKELSMRQTLTQVTSKAVQELTNDFKCTQELTLPTYTPDITRMRSNRYAKVGTQ